MTSGASVPDSSTKPSTSSLILSRWLFLRGLGLVHFVAFGSYALQIIGLNGGGGIEPTRELLQSAHQYFGAQAFYFMENFQHSNQTACW